MAFDFGVTGNTKLDTSGFTKGISSMTVAAGNLIADLTKTATSKLAGLATSSVQVGMQFDASMSQVAATMGTTVDQIDSLTKVAKEMGSTTKFTATQAADALNYLALAGYDADKAAEVLPSVLNLAAAGGMDLAYASDLVTDAMASLNIEANKQNVDEFGNKLAMAASKANANVSQLGEAILTVGGTAANLKGGTTELTTALGLLANVGIKGAEGGTHLRNIILSLQSPTDDASKMMQKLGLQVYDAQGNMRGLNDILGDLNGAMKGMTQGQKDGIINQLFNKTDLAAVNGLLAAQGEQWETLAEQIDNADGAMEQMAETQIDNLDGAVTIMQSALEGLQLAVYQQLEPALTDVVKWGTDCLGQLTNALTDGGPEAMLDAAGQIISDLAAGVAEQLPGLAETGVELVAALAEKAVAAAPAMLTVAAEVLGALVQGLSAALPQLVSTGLQMISQLGEGLKAGLPELLAQALPIVADFASGLRENVGQIVDTGIEFILNLAQGIADGLPTLIEQLPGIVSDLAGIINDNAPKLLLAGVYLIETLGKGLIDAIPTIVANIPQICQAIFDVFTAFRWLDIGKFIVDGLWNGITAGWTALVSKVTDLVNMLPKAAKLALGIHSPSKVFDEIGVQVCNGLAQGLGRGNKKVKNAAKTIIASVTDTATTLNDGVTRTVETVTEKMASGATQQKQVITETSRQLVNGVLKDVKTVTEIAADGTKTVKQTMETVRDVVSTVNSTQSSIVDGAKVTVEKTTETLADGSTQVKTMTTKTGKEIIDGVEHTVKTVVTKTADGVETTVKTIEDAGPQYASAGELLTSQLRTKLEEGWDGIQKDIQTDALGAIKTLANTLKNGDFEQLGLWAAEYFWHACTEEQRSQITDLAKGALNQLSIALSGVGNNLAQLANSLVAKFVPAAASATTGQVALNTAMDANPILLVISLIGMLVGALLNLASTNKSVASGMQNVWQGVGDFISVVFEGLLYALGVVIEGFVVQVNLLIGAYNLLAGVLNLSKLDYVSNPAWDYAQKLKADREARKTAQAAEKDQAALDAKYAEDSVKAQKKQLDAEYAQKEAELQKAKLSSSDPGMLDAEKAAAKADYEKAVADLEKELLDAAYKKNSAQISQRTETDAAQKAELKKQIAEAENTLKLGEIERQLLQLDYEKTLKELEAKYGKTTDPDPATPEPDPGKDNTDAIRDNTEALLAANEKLAEMVRQADSLVLSDNMAVRSSVAASGTAQVAAAASSYRREGDTTIIQNIHSKAQTAADLQREARWEADRAKAQKH